MLRSPVASAARPRWSPAAALAATLRRLTVGALVGAAALLPAPRAHAAPTAGPRLPKPLAAAVPDAPLGGRHELREAVPGGTRSATAPFVARPVARRVARGAREAPRGVAGPPLAGRTFRTDSIVVEKGLHRMTLFAGGTPLRTYDVALGLNPTGAKRKAGDFRTPEGLYHISARNPNSKFHRALRISYPSAEDVARARALGVSPGGDVMVHGLPNGQGDVGMFHRSYDWTNGCVAVTDEEMDEIWEAVPVGTPIRILP